MWHPIFPFKETRSCQIVIPFSRRNVWKMHPPSTVYWKLSELLLKSKICCDFPLVASAKIANCRNWELREVALLSGTELPEPIFTNHWHRSCDNRICRFNDMISVFFIIRVSVSSPEYSPGSIELRLRWMLDRSRCVPSWLHISWFGNLWGLEGHIFDSASFQSLKITAALRYCFGDANVRLM
jgi:hypothetical protein